jgi:oxygen-dependent protoporphyrinogen oxidase
VSAEPERPFRAAVVGGGIAGLAAANRLQDIARERGLRLDVLVLEASGRLGGAIATERTDGFVIEAGPDSFISEKPWALELCRRLGLGDRLTGTREEHRRTYIVHGGRLHPLPEGFLLLAPTRLSPLVASRLFSWRGKLRMALDLVLPRGAARADESLASFVTRRLGREALVRVAEPLVGGIYTADAETLSLAATMPRFLEMERRHRSLILAMLAEQRRQAGGQDGAAPRRPPPGDHGPGGSRDPGRTAGSGARWSLFVTLAEGMQSLVDALAARFPAGAIRLGAVVGAVAPGAAPGTWRVALADGVGLDADAVVLATPAHRTARILADVDSDLAALLDGIPYASSATVSLAYRREDVPHPLDGFGFVVPRAEARAIIAATFSSVKYPGRAPSGHVLLRAFLGGALQSRLADPDDTAMVTAVRREFSDLLGVGATPVLARIHRHPQAMPQYRVGHLERVAAIDARLRQYPGLTLAGNAYRGVGLPDCVRSGEAAAEAIAGEIAARRR